MQWTRYGLAPRQGKSLSWAAAVTLNSCEHEPRTNTAMFQSPHLLRDGASGRLSSGIRRTDSEDLPVELTLVHQRQNADGNHGDDLARLARVAPELDDVHRVAISTRLVSEGREGHAVRGVFPSLEKVEKITCGKQIWSSMSSS